MESPQRLVITSIGTATPRDAASVALGLGVSVPEVVSAFYRAPTTLAENLPQSTAEPIAAILRSLGCEVEITDGPPPEPATLLDVAVYVTDTERFTDIANATAAFLGCTPEEAQRLLTSLPPVVLGKVSAATVEALRARLGDGADVLASDPQQARFDVLLGDYPAPHRARLITTLRAEGLDPTDDGPWLLRDLTWEQAEHIWAAHRRTPNLQILNRDLYPAELMG